MKNLMSKYWYPMTLLPLFIAFMTPGFTFIAFTLWLLLTGYAFRPIGDQLLGIEKKLPMPPKPRKA